MKKALQVASVASMIDQFTMPNIQILQELGYSVEVAANFHFGSTTSDERVAVFREELLKQNIAVHNVLFNRSIFDKKNIEAYQQLKSLLQTGAYDIVHCHSPIGGVVTRLASRIARKKGTKVYYTAHGFHFYKGAPLLNWLLYFPIEWACSFFTDVLITINQEDYQFAKRVMRAKQIEYVPGVGVDVNRFSETQVDTLQYKQQLGLSPDDVVLLSVGELNKNKNHEVAIRAMAANKETNPNMVYLICGKGALEPYLRQLCVELGIDQQVRFLGYRDDISKIMQLADVFVFPSFREGLSLALMEAMASALPVICSDIRGNKDLIEQNVSGFLCDPSSMKQFSHAFKKLVNNNQDRVKMGNASLEKIRLFDIAKIKNHMVDIYNLKQKSNAV